MRYRCLLLISFMAILVLVIFVGIRYGSERTLATSRLPDGTEMRIVGKPRVFEILGIEIVDCKVTRDGRVQPRAVNDLCSSWAESERKYANRTGGGLLPEPRQSEEQGTLTR